MKITALSAQIRDPDRVNVSIDGKYRFSLDIAQVIELGVKQGQEIDEERLAELELESQFGKLYARALEYCLTRPHSAREVRDYLYRKTRPTKYLKKPPYASRGSRQPSPSSRTVLEQGGGREVVERPGVPVSVTERVFDRLVERGYIDDEKFARWWIENRHQTKGISQRKLTAELRGKGIEPSLIDHALTETERSDDDELAKIIAKKRRRYPDEAKFIVYLQRQGFRYDDIRARLASDE